MPFDHDYDDFKTYPARWLGYSSGFAEAVRGPLPFSAVKALHAITTGFIFGHTLYKPYKLNEKRQSSRKMIMAAADTLVYETLASGVLPPVVAWAVRSGTGTLFGRANKTLQAWGSSIVAVSVLLLISRPSDVLVDSFMDATIRTMY